MKISFLADLLVVLSLEATVSKPRMERKLHARKGFRGYFDLPFPQMLLY